MKLTTIGIDLAKNVFQLHGADATGRAVLKKQLKRAQVLPFFANLACCRIGMEACGSAHYWARKLRALGHQVQLIPPQYVKPFVKRNKNDAADAEAIYEAILRPNMAAVPIKTASQQAILSVHRARQGFVKARTAQANQIRGLLAEYGIVIGRGMVHLGQPVAQILQDGENDLPGSFRLLIQRLVDHLEQLDRQVRELELEIARWHKDNEASLRLARIPGIGPMTASALVASVGEANNFRNARQLAAWLGLVPRQHSSGGKSILLGISKRGDSYLRTLLIHGARSVVRMAERRQVSDSWLNRLLVRRHKNVVAVALANKNARTAWALLAHGRDYQPDYATPA
ncbi:MAG: IS110 family transposase [Gammaproteobacteria bacterium]|nr:IS110 family transposase [Gammaproteobacteria bacterium]